MSDAPLGRGGGLSIRLEGVARLPRSGEVARPLTGTRRAKALETNGIGLTDVTLIGR